MERKNSSKHSKRKNTMNELDHVSTQIPRIKNPLERFASIHAHSRFAFGLLALLLGAGRATAARPAPYLCNKVANGLISVDGRIDEAAWQAAEPITNFYVYRPVGGTNRSPTEVRILWDSQNLYVAFRCTDADIWSYSNEPDAELWRGDACEFFVKPSRTSLVYYEFVMAPNGTLLDVRNPSRGAGGAPRFKTWPSHARVATAVDGTDGNVADADTGYTIEMAIPLKAFAGATPPADGVAWTFGAFRFDYSKLYEDPLLLMSIPESPSGFHYYEGYANLVFREE